MDKHIREKYIPVIGLEVHAQLLTNSKIFSSDSSIFGNSPNTNISVITLGHPGTLPKLNKKAVEHAIKMGIACNCTIAKECIFDRKNYFYPDLPKGYQITQDKTPICVGGFVKVRTKNGHERSIRLNRIHLEDDAGKSIHLPDEPDTLVDFNRAGVPLIEIVTEPDLRSSEEASVLLTEIRKLVRYLEVCDGNMEEGSMRCDANVSVMLKGAKEYGKKVEVKNMNSIKNVQRAIDHEIARQIRLLEKGEVVISETRTFDAVSGTTAPMRTKEELNDYRYFPEPDLSPLQVSDQWLAAIKATMPALPSVLLAKFQNEFQLPYYDALILTESKEYASCFEEVCQHTKNYKAASNWLMGPVKSYLNEAGLSIKDCAVSPQKLAELINLIDQGDITYSIASQQVFPALIKDQTKTCKQLIADLNLTKNADTDSIQTVIDEILNSLPDKVAAYKSGKNGLIAMFMGEVMKKTKGKADPKIANELLRKSLA